MPAQGHCLGIELALGTEQAKPPLQLLFSRGERSFQHSQQQVVCVENIVLATPAFDGRLPGIVAEALTKFDPYDLTGITVLPVITLADSTGEIREALFTDLREALPGATLAEPLALLGETPEEISSQLTPRLDELIKSRFQETD